MKGVLIFDFDGVLADTRAFMLATAGEVCSQLGYPCTPQPADLEALDPMSFDNLGRHLGIPQELVPEFTRRNLQAFGSPPEPMPLFAGWEQVIPRLATSCRLGLVTGNSAGAVRSFLHHYQLAQYFAMILTLEDPGERADKVRRITLALDGKSDRTYLVGDAVSDIRAARQAGIRSVAVSWGHQSLDKLQRAGPDRVIHTPQDLLSLVELP